MPVKIRLQRRGRKKRPFYHIVVADARAPRDGRFIEKIGIYNPMTKPATIDLDRDLAFDWLMKGAQPTETARAILRFKGVLYRKHLMRGVLKGALTQEQADAKYQEWIATKEAKIAARFEQTAQEKAAYLAMINGTPPKKAAAPAPEAATEGAPEAQDDRSFAESVEQTTVESFSGDQAEAPAEETAAPAEEPAAETPAAEAEAPAEEPVAEAPAEEAAAETPAEEPAAADDLTKIEGIGPKIAETFTNAGIATFANLAEADVEKLKGILSEASLGSHDPTTWPKQAGMAAEGKWDELKKWQDELDGGKEVEPKKDEE